MKRNFFISLILMCLVGVIKAETVSHTFNFSESDFEIFASDTDSLIISSIKDAATYPDPSQPGIPILGRNLALSANETVTNVTYTFNKRLIRSGVDLKNAPMAIPTSMSIDDVITPPGGYAANVYPSTNCTLSKCYRIGGVNIASLLVTPFVFDAQNRNLYFVDSLQVELETEVSMARNIIPGTTASQMELLEATVENTSFLDRVDITLPPVEEDDYCEYLIITKENFKNAFQPLADWKRKKGVPSKIMTVEEIERTYTSNYRHMRIKEYIKDMYENNGLNFVLLGGDVETIPVQYCCVEGAKAGDPVFIPADIYYACMDDIVWDTNGDGKAATTGDNVSIVPNINVTRASVTSVEEVNIFVNRIIDYEKSPNFINLFLQAGARLDFYFPSHPVAERIYNDVIYGNINLESVKYFDTYTSSGLTFTKQGFSDELAKGYQFAEVISHGSSHILSNENGTSFYDLQFASSLNNAGHTLLTTTACYTNSFDNEEVYEPNPCLSEALMRNPNSGIIGYLGSSSSGWHEETPIPSMTLSFSYEKDFYERLLNTETQFPRVKHFGALVNFIKHTHISFLENDMIYRWLHFSINALGDPETPIFNTNPIENTSATAEFDENGTLVVDTGIDGAKVCVSSSDNACAYFYETSNGSQISTFDTGFGTFDVWITKQNYIPKHFTVSRYQAIELIETKITSISPNPATDNITVQYQSAFSGIDLKLMLTRTSGLGFYEFDLDASENEATLDISNVQSGMYVVSLVDNGATLYSFPSRLIVE